MPRASHKSLARSKHRHLPAKRDLRGCRAQGAMPPIGERSLCGLQISAHTYTPKDRCARRAETSAARHQCSAHCAEDRTTSITREAPALQEERTQGPARSPLAMQRASAHARRALTNPTAAAPRRGGAGPPRPCSPCQGIAEFSSRASSARACQASQWPRWPRKVPLHAAVPIPGASACWHAARVPGDSHAPPVEGALAQL